MEESNKSEEELAEVKASEHTSEEETKTNVEVEEEEKNTEEETSEEEPSTVPLSDHTRTKDVLHRLADRVIENDDKLAALAEEDPKLLERLKSEFPKRFKDIIIPAKVVTEETIDERVKAAVATELKNLGKSDTLDALREEIGMTKMEFEDIKSSVSEKANRLLDLELADSYKDAILLAYKDLAPSKYKDLVAKRVAKENADVHSKTSAKTTGAKKFSKAVLDNWKTMGFNSAEQMVEYQDKSNIIPIADSIMN